MRFKQLVRTETFDTYLALTEEGTLVAIEFPEGVDQTNAGEVVHYRQFELQEEFPEDEEEQP